MTAYCSRQYSKSRVLNPIPDCRRISPVDQQLVDAHSWTIICRSPGVVYHLCFIWIRLGPRADKRAIGKLHERLQYGRYHRRLSHRNFADVVRSVSHNMLLTRCAMGLRISPVMSKRPRGSSAVGDFLDTGSDGSLITAKMFGLG